MGEVIDLQDARERRRKRKPDRPIPHDHALPVNPRAFIYGLGGFVRISSGCTGLAHNFPQVPGYCDCGAEYYDGRNPSTGVFMNTTTDPIGGST